MATILNASLAATMSTSLKTPIIVFTRTASMAILLSHYRPSCTIFAFTNEERIKRRLILYQGVTPISMEFSDDAEETFSKAFDALLNKGFLKEGQEVMVVQSGKQPIWRSQSTQYAKLKRSYV